MEKHSKRILVIDDNETLLESIADYLEDRDFIVMTALNGKEGIDIIQRERPDVIITDLRMPQTDGLQVIESAKGIVPDTPLIVVSGTGKISDSVQALRLGAWDYILKPIEDMNIILHAVKNALQKAGLIQENRNYQKDLEGLIQQRTEELQRANTDLTAINNRLKRIVGITRALSKCSDIESFAERLLKDISHNMGASGGSIYLIEDNGLKKLFAIDEGHSPQYVPFPLKKGSVFQRTIETKSPLLIEDISKENSIQPSGNHYTNGSLLSFPMQNEEGIMIGILSLHCKKPPPFIDQDKEIGSILATFSCETIRAIRSQEALKNSEQRMSAISHYAHDGIIMMDDNGNVSFWNPAAEKIFGFKKEEMLGKNLHQIIAPEDRRVEYQNAFAKFQKTGQVMGRTIELEGLTKDNKVIPVELSVSAINFNNSWHSIGIVRDTRERKKMEQEHQKIQKLESIGILAGGIAHDFNNVLTGIYGNIQLAKIETDKNHRAYTYIDTASKSIERATRLTRQLLTFAKGGDPVMEAVNIKQLIEETLNFSLSGSNIKAITYFPDDIWDIKADKGQVSQVLSNLIINAKQAMDDGGSMYIRIENIGPVHIGPSSETNVGHVRITIKDEGTGIPKENISKIFDPYFTTKETGNGLGLAIVYRIIRKHRGTINVDSVPGKGTRFIIDLPAEKTNVTPEQGSKEMPLLSIPGQYRVLIMDDERSIRDLSRDLLSLCGFKTESVPNGTEAVREYKRALEEGKPYHIIIMDLTIPGGMGGREAITRILDMDPTVRAIVSSGYSTDPVMANYQKYGFKGKLIKPFNLEDLQREINRVLGLLKL